MAVSKQISLGPLTGLVGKWRGNKGKDIAPEPGGPDENLFYETIEYTVVGDEIENAEDQVLTSVHYRQIVKRKSNDEVFHDETGYWMWDAKANLIMHSLVIPRGVGVLAGGKHDGTPNENGEIVLNVSAGLKNPEWEIMQSPFMSEKAQTTAFEHHIIIKDDTLSYFEHTTVEIYGRTFDHTDENELTRCD